MSEVKRPWRALAEILGTDSPETERIIRELEKRGLKFSWTDEAKAAVERSMAATEKQLGPGFVRVGSVFYKKEQA